MLAVTTMLRKRSRKEWLSLWKDKMMLRISLNFGHVMNMVIMHLSVLKEKESIRKDSNLEDLEIVYILMKKKRKKNLIKTKVKMN